MKNAVTFLFACLGFFLILVTCLHNNLGATADSLNYITIARNIQLGNGFVDETGTFISHWPPLYAMVLASVSAIFQEDPMAVGIGLNALLLAFTFLIFNEILSLFKISIFPRIVTNTALLLSYALNVFTFFYSEALFIPLLLLIIWSIIKWEKSGSKSFLIMAGVFSGLLLVCRYAGLGFLGGILIYLFFLQKNTWKNRFKNTSIFSFALVPLPLGWLFYAKTMAEESTRTLSFHPIPFRAMLSFFKTIFSWFVPFKSDLLIGVSIIVMFFVASILIFRISEVKKKIYSTFQANKNISQLLLLVCAIYVVFIIISISFFDAQTPMDNRILSPIFPILLLIISPFIENLKGKRNLNIVITVFLIPMLITSVIWWSDIYKNGQGFTAAFWKNSSTLKAVAHFSDKKIITNSTEIINLYYPNLKGEKQSLPIRFNTASNEPEPEYAQNLSELKNSLEENKSVIIYFDEITWRDYLVPKDTLLKVLKDQSILPFSDGVIIK